MTATITPPRAIEAIAIGASAGGVDALMEVLPAVPRRFRGAVFVVLHLPRNRRSLLADIFAGKCDLRVCEAEDKEAVEPGTIYFAPPDYHLLVDTGPTLALSTDEPVNFSRPSIDVLFESASEVYGPRLLGVILTGASQDGAAGLEAVRQRGGQTIVQDPATAQASLMGEAALRRGVADRVLSLGAIAQLFAGLTDGVEA